MPRSNRRFVSLVFAGFAVAAVAVGLATLVRSTPTAEAYVAFDNTTTDQEHHRNDILLPRVSPVEIVRPEFASLQAADTVSLQILSANDFHGNLEPPTGSGGNIALPAGWSYPAAPSS